MSEPIFDELADEPPVAPRESALRSLAMQIRYDLTAAQGKLTELIRQIDQLNLEPDDRLRCPQCTLDVAGPRSLAEHIYLIHDGPRPAHWEQDDGHARTQTQPVEEPGP